MGIAMGSCVAEDTAVAQVRQQHSAAAAILLPGGRQPMRVLVTAAGPNRARTTPGASLVGRTDGPAVRWAVTGPT